jgi:hypothetical protein
MLAIDDMIAALVRLGDDAAAARLKDTRRHNSWLLSQHLKAQTSDDSEEFHGFGMNGPVTDPHRSGRDVEKARKSAATSRFSSPTSRKCNSSKIFAAAGGTGSAFLGQPYLVGSARAHLTVAPALAPPVNDERDDREGRGGDHSERQGDDIVQLLPPAAFLNLDQVRRHALRHDLKR